MSEPLDHSAHSETTDKKFFDQFMLVLGGLILFSLFLIFLARVIGGNTQVQYQKEDPAYKGAADERIRPATLLAVAGQDNSAVEAAAPAAPAPAASTEVLGGEAVYNMACVACHGAGIGGAPAFGNRAAWTARLAQGEALLREHAIKGFQGQAGLMPAKGGRVDLSDESVINAVDYMIQAVR